MDIKKKRLWDHQGKLLAYQMYNQGYDDPITAYQIVSNEEVPNQQVVAQQKDFNGDFDSQNK